MANNYQSRIELIVDDIAKDNVEFKAKTIPQQNAQKTDMILSISKSIAGLNDVGQNLVLNDIEKEVRENRIDIIDSSGNINVTELTRFTSTLVKAKIDEFERQGINLRLDSQITGDSKISVTETVLSVAVINEMVNNYENLSFKDRTALLDNWENLTNAQRSQISMTKSKMLLKRAEEIDDPQSKKALIDLAEVEKINAEISNEIDKMTDEQSDYVIEVFNVQYGNEFGNFYSNNNGKSKKQVISEFIASKDKRVERVSENCYNKGTLTDREFEDVANIKKEKRQLRVLWDKEYMEKFGGLEAFRRKSKEEQEQIVDNYFIHINPEIHDDESKEEQVTESFIDEIPEKSGEIEVFQSKSEEEQKQIIDKYFKSKGSLSIGSLTKEKLKIIKQSYSEIDFFEKYSKITDFQSDEILSQEQQLQEEIRQIPSELAKTGYSQEEIKNALSIYNQFFSGLNNESIENFFKDKTEDELKETLSLVFSSFKETMDSKSYEALQKIAQNDFGGHLQQYLTSPELLQGTFIPALTAEIEQLERISDQEFNRHYRGQEVDLDASAAEALKEQRGTSEKTSNVQEEPQEETPTDTTGQADSSTAEHKPQDEVETPLVQGTESSQNMALVEQDNSFLGKIKRTMSKIKSSIKAKVSKFLGKEDKSTIEEDKTTSSEQVEAETTVPELHNTLDRYNYRDNDLEKNALNNFNQSRNTTKEQSERSDTEPGD